MGLHAGSVCEGKARVLARGAKMRWVAEDRK